MDNNNNNITVDSKYIMERYLKNTEYNMYRNIRNKHPGGVKI